MCKDSTTTNVAGWMSFPETVEVATPEEERDYDFAEKSKKEL